MKKQLFVFGFVLLLMLSIVSAMNTTSLEAYYSFDNSTTDFTTNTTLDLSGNGNHATLRNIVSSVETPQGQGFQFSPSLFTSVDVYNSNIYTGGTNKTVCAYMTTNSFYSSTAHQTIVANQNSLGTGAGFSYYYSSSNGPLMYRLNFGLQQKFANIPGFGASRTFVCHVEENSNNYFYINGVKYTGATNGALTPSETGRFSIGATYTSNTTYSAGFDGIIDEVAIWRRALPIAEILLYSTNGYNFTIELPPINTTPSFSELLLTPSLPTIASTLRLNVTAIDVDSSSVNATVQWFNSTDNNTFVTYSSPTVTNISNSTNTLVALLTNSTFMEGQYWKAQVTLSDSNSSTVQNTTSVYITPPFNSQPSVSLIRILPLSPATNENLIAEINISDAENSSINGFVQWYNSSDDSSFSVYGMQIPFTVTNNTVTQVNSLLANNTQINQTWIVGVTVIDKLFSVSQNSTSVLITSEPTYGTPYFVNVTVLEPTYSGAYQIAYKINHPSQRDIYTQIDWYISRDSLSFSRDRSEYAYYTFSDYETNWLYSSDYFVSQLRNGDYIQAYVTLYNGSEYNRIQTDVVRYISNSSDLGISFAQCPNTTAGKLVFFGFLTLMFIVSIVAIAKFNGTVLLISAILFGFSLLIIYPCSAVIGYFVVGYIILLLLLMSSIKY